MIFRQKEIVRKNVAFSHVSKKGIVFNVVVLVLSKKKNLNDNDGIGLKENISNNKTWKYFKYLKVNQEKRKKKNKKTP